VRRSICYVYLSTVNISSFVYKVTELLWEWWGVHWVGAYFLYLPTLFSILEEFAKKGKLRNLTTFEHISYFLLKRLFNHYKCVIFRDGEGCASVRLWDTTLQPGDLLRGCRNHLSVKLYPSPLHPLLDNTARMATFLSYLLGFLLIRVRDLADVDEI
jgi:hypothetical protein